MKISHIEHLGIAVESIEAALPYYEKRIGSEVLQHRRGGRPKGEDRFLESRRSENRTLGADKPGQSHRQIPRKRRPWRHHVAFCIEDGVANALAECEEKGIRLIDKAPRLEQRSCKSHSCIPNRLAAY